MTTFCIFLSSRLLSATTRLVFRNSVTDNPLEIVFFRSPAVNRAFFKHLHNLFLIFLNPFGIFKNCLLDRFDLLLRRTYSFSSSCRTLLQVICHSFTCRSKIEAKARLESDTRLTQKALSPCLEDREAVYDLVL
jgi:hypothetical protein